MYFQGVHTFTVSILIATASFLQLTTEEGVVTPDLALGFNGEMQRGQVGRA